MASGCVSPQPEADATNAQFKVESEKLRHNAITEMLLERRSVVVLVVLKWPIQDQSRDSKNFIRSYSSEFHKRGRFFRI